MVDKKRKKEKMGKTTPPTKPQSGGSFAFSRDNYKWLIIGVVISFLGYILMSGGGTDDPTQFAGDTLFSPLRMTVAPILIIGGFIVVLYAIMKKQKD